MRLLLFSDLHLDAAFAWLAAAGKPDTARRRRQGLRDTLRRIAMVAQEQKVDALLCAGDLYEQQRFTPDTAAFVQSVFADLHPLPVFVAPGNHDWLGRGSLYATVDWSPNVHIFAEDRLTARPLAEGLTLWGAAHRAPAGTGGFLHGFKVDRGGIHLGLFHGSEQGGFPLEEGGKQPHAPFRAEQVAEAGLSHAFVGHFHRARDAEWHTYPGNPDPLTFGEDGGRGAVLVNVSETGAISRERITVAGTQVHDVRVSVEGCRSGQDVREALASATRGLVGLVRASLHGDLAVEIDLAAASLDTAAPWLDALVVRHADVHVGYDVERLSSEATVRGEFVRGVLATGDLTESERRRVLLVGLRALDGREDLAVAIS